MYIKRMLVYNTNDNIVLVTAYLLYSIKTEEMTQPRP